MTKNVYLAGGCLTRGEQLQRAEEAEMIRELGHTLYVPQENKEINDKANAVQENLAERIVRHDTDAIRWSDTVIIEPSSNAFGTMVELGQLKGMKDVSTEVVDLIDSCFKKGMSHISIINEVYDACTTHTQRKIYPHIEDVRLLGPTGDGYRSTFGVNAYVTGVAIDLADNLTGAPDGFYTMDAIVKDLSRDNI